MGDLKQKVGLLQSEETKVNETNLDILGKINDMQGDLHTAA